MLLGIGCIEREAIGGKSGGGQHELCGLEQVEGMSRSLNRVQLLGHLGKDIEVRFTPNGTQIGQFSVATSRRWKDKNSGEWKEETDWHRCILWRCENLAKFLTKGKQVWIEGRLQTRSYDKDGQKHYATEVVCDDLILLGGGDRGEHQPAARGPEPEMSGQGITDDDVPF
jgi:single-strand DNA-binding protein